MAVDVNPGEEADPWLGRVVDRRYRVLSRLGSGGMGVVYRVEHLQLGKVAAMKVLHADGAKNKEIVRRFHLEAQSVSQLNHPNIVQTFDFGQWDGSLYLIMEYVKGEDLGAALTREGPMPFRRAAKLFIQVCSALTEAHECGIIHRDLKPENLMTILRRDHSEHAKVLDFGLVKLRERDDAASITAGGAVVGTPYYMSPEQVRAEPLDARADVYSLGATLYRVLTGLPPFQAASPFAVLAKHLTEEAVPPGVLVPELCLPREVDVIVMRAMAKSAADRYASAALIQADLEAALAAVRSADNSAAAIDITRRQDLSAAITEATTISIESDLGGDGQRLRRRDLDEFEHSLRRRRVVNRLIVPAVLLGLLAGGGALYFRTSLPRAVTVEGEPNDTAGYANTIASDVPVKGTIGKNREDARPDLDYYQLPSGRGSRVVSARLEGATDVDLVLELFDAQGRKIAKADARGPGWAEWLQPTSLGPAGGYLLVRQEWVEGAPPPAPNAGNQYALTAHWGAPQPDWEVEPNDWEEVATPVNAGRAIHGYLGSADDKDWFSFTPAATGRLIGRVRVPVGVDVVLVSGPAADRKLTDQEGPGRDEEFALPAQAGQPILLGIMRKPRDANARDPKIEGLPGLEEPYELRSELIPAPAPDPAPTP